MGSYPERWDPPGVDVRGEVFAESGKWKYSVKLDYTRTADITSESGYVDPADAALLALATATRAGTSDVTFEKLHDGWTLVVPDPPNGWPVMVTAGRFGR